LPRTIVGIWGQLIKVLLPS